MYISKAEMSKPSVAHRNSPLFQKIAQRCVTVGETVTMNVGVGVNMCELACDLRTIY